MVLSAVGEVLAARLLGAGARSGEVDEVEVALAASDDREGVTIDYRVYEEKPWSIYAQASGRHIRTGVWGGIYTQASGGE